MPFKSDKQRNFLYAKKPDVAKKFAKHDKMPGKADQLAAIKRKIK